MPADQVDEYFNFLAFFIGLDNPVSSQFTQHLLGWMPSQPGLLADLELGHYFQ